MVRREREYTMVWVFNLCRVVRRGDREMRRGEDGEEQEGVWRSTKNDGPL